MPFIGAMGFSLNYFSVGFFVFLLECMQYVVFYTFWQHLLYNVNKYYTFLKKQTYCLSIKFICAVPRHSLKIKMAGTKTNI